MCVQCYELFGENSTYKSTQFFLHVSSNDKKIYSFKFVRLVLRLFLLLLDKT